MKKKIYLIKCEVLYEKYERRPFGMERYMKQERTSEFQGFVLAENEEVALKKANKYYDAHASTCKRIANNDCTYVEVAKCAEGVLTARETARVNYDKLKQDMPSQDFLAYCKQELFAIEDII